MKVFNLDNRSSAYHCMPLIDGLELKSNKEEEIGGVHEFNLVKREVVNEREQLIFAHVIKRKIV